MERLPTGNDEDYLRFTELLLTVLKFQHKA